MRFAKLSQEQIHEVQRIYEGVMSHACHGLFFREGIVFGREIAGIAARDRTQYLATSKKLIESRGWAESIELADQEARATESIEAAPGHTRNCHRLRGILREVYAGHLGGQVEIDEVECVPGEGGVCRFTVNLLRA